MTTSAEQNPQEEENVQSETQAAETTASEQTEQQDPQIDGEDTKPSELDELRDKYLRLQAEFDNFRRRTSKERLELFKTANQELMVALLPVVDDFERAQSAIKDAQEVTVVREGVELVFNKLQSILNQKGLKAMDAVGQP
uniref:nucleotide exchange factor GrpE n=1 Tax=Neisseria meningitidis TaxID=487 RepID=UPI000BB5F192